MKKSDVATVTVKGKGMPTIVFTLEEVKQEFKKAFRKELIALMREMHKNR